MCWCTGSRDIVLCTGKRVTAFPIFKAEKLLCKSLYVTYTGLKTLIPLKVDQWGNLQLIHIENNHDILYCVAERNILKQQSQNRNISIYFRCDEDVTFTPSTPEERTDMSPNNLSVTSPYAMVSDMSTEIISPGNSTSSKTISRICDNGFKPATLIIVFVFILICIVLVITVIKYISLKRYMKKTNHVNDILYEQNPIYRKTIISMSEADQTACSTV